MRAALNALDFDPDPRSLPADPASFAFLARLFVGPDGGLGPGETFDVTVCSPEWLSRQCSKDGIWLGLHHVFVNQEEYNDAALRAWFERRVAAVEGETWADLAVELGRLGGWEFDGYRA